MNELITRDELPPCSPEDVKAMDDLMDEVKKLPQVMIAVDHFIHAGMYVRTCFIPAGYVIVGALIKVPTVLIVNGHCKVTVGSRVKMIDGYVVLKAGGGRRQAFLAIDDTYVTMQYATKAETVEQAEREFTDEYDLLQTNNKGDVCQV